MDFLTFLANTLEHLAWPAVVVAGAWMFRVPITGLLDALKNAKLTVSRKDGGVTIESELNTVREKLEVPQQAALPAPIPKIAGESPKQVIEQAWNEVEESAGAAMSIKTRPPAFEMANQLVQRQILNPPEAEAYYKLHEISAQVTKPESTFVTDVSSAASYSSLAHVLVERIRKRET